MEETTTKKCVRQFLFVVRGDHNNRALFRLDPLLRFVNVEAHPVELLQKVIREFDIGFVDLIDEKNRKLL